MQMLRKIFNTKVALTIILFNGFLKRISIFTVETVRLYDLAKQEKFAKANSSEKLHLSDLKYKGATASLLE